MHPPLHATHLHLLLQSDGVRRQSAAALKSDILTFQLSELMRLHRQLPVQVTTVLFFECAACAGTRHRRCTHHQPSAHMISSWYSIRALVLELFLELAVELMRCFASSDCPLLDSSLALLADAPRVMHCFHQGAGSRALYLSLSNRALSLSLSLSTALTALVPGLRARLALRKSSSLDLRSRATPL
jgi:hypothetical protein